MCHNATLVLMDHRGAEEQKVKNNLKLGLCLVNILDDDEPEEVLDVLHDQIRLKISTEVRACTRICSQLEKDGEEILTKIRLQETRKECWNIGCELMNLNSVKSSLNLSLGASFSYLTDEVVTQGNI